MDIHSPQHHLEDHHHHHHHHHHRSRHTPTPPEAMGRGGGQSLTAPPPPPPHPHLAAMESRWASANSLISVSSTDSRRQSASSEGVRRMSEVSAFSEGDTPSILPILHEHSSPDSSPSRKSNKRGREERHSAFDYLTEPPDHLNCSICAEVFTKPMIVNGCGHEFCDGCLKRSLMMKPECPLCRQPVDIHNQFATPLRRVQEEADRLIVRCPFTEDGCDATLPRKDMTQHIGACSFAIVDCDHAEYGCQWEGSRGALQHHLEDCQFEKFKGFTNKTCGELAEARATVNAMEREVKRLRVLENIMKCRGERIKQAHRHRLGLVDATTKDKVTVVHVMEKGTVQWMFKVKMCTKLGKIVDLLHSKRDTSIVLTCDGPLSMGGTVVENQQTLFDLGMSPTEPAVNHAGALLFAETL